MTTLITALVLASLLTCGFWLALRKRRQNGVNMPLNKITVPRIRELIKSGFMANK